MPATRSRRATNRPKPRADAYVGLLVISLLAMIAGCVLLFLDYNEYMGAKGNPKQIIQQMSQRPAPQPPAGQPGGGVAGVPPGGGAAGVPPGGGAAGVPPGGGMMGGVPPGGGMMGGVPPGGMMGGVPKGGAPK